MDENSSLSGPGGVTRSSSSIGNCPLTTLSKPVCHKVRVPERTETDSSTWVELLARMASWSSSETIIISCKAVLPENPVFAQY